MEKKLYLPKTESENFHLLEESLSACEGDFPAFFSALKNEYTGSELAGIYSSLFKNIKNLDFLDVLIREIDSLRDKKNLDDLIDFLLEFDANAVHKDDYGAFINLRVLCLKAISNYKDTKSITPVLYCLNNKNEHYKARLAAAEALGKIGDKNAVESLINVVSDEDEKSVYVRESAAVALGMIGDMRAVDPFLSILEAKKNFLDKFTFLKERVIEALGKFNMPYNKRVFLALKEALLDDSPQVRLNAVESLMNIATDGGCKHAEAVELIKNMLKDSDEEVARNSVAALYNISGAEILYEILKDDSMPLCCKEEAHSILEEELSEEEDE